MIPHSLALRRWTWLALALALLAASGCTHVQLRKNTIRQAWTLGEIQQQQVLNNLAMFVYNPNSLPSFAVPNQGGTNVTDSGTTTVTPSFLRVSGDFVFNALGMNFGATRQAQESFTMTPVNDPRKLELMRCAYQQAVANCGRGQPSEHCPDCKSIMNRFYTGDPDGDIAARTGGTVNSECLNSHCWFGWGCKSCVPKNCPCTYVGEYCGVYVWVLPEGREELTKLTLAILDFALNNPPTLRTKQVLYYIDEYGLPTQQARAVGTVTAVVNIDERTGSLLNNSSGEQARLEQIIKARLQVINENLARLEANKHLDDKFIADQRTHMLAERQALEQKLQYISEQFRTGALKEKYYPPSPSTTPGSLLLPFNMQQDILTPGRMIQSF